jgi:hypothetical protein
MNGERKSIYRILLQKLKKWVSLEESGSLETKRGLEKGTCPQSMGKEDL